VKTAVEEGKKILNFMVKWVVCSLSTAGAKRFDALPPLD
jgi:hypothetical protein